MPGSHSGLQTDIHQWLCLPLPSSQSESPTEFIHEDLEQTTACTLKPETGQLKLQWQASDQTLCLSHIALHLKLTMPWEDAVEKANKRKSLKCTELAADVEQHGWKAKVQPVEVGCRGFIGKSTTRLLKDLGVQGQDQRQAIKGPLQYCWESKSVALDQEERQVLVPERTATKAVVQRRLGEVAGHTWEAKYHRWAPWKCYGSIIETPVKEGAHLMTQMKLVLRSSLLKTKTMRQENVTALHRSYACYFIKRLSVTICFCLSFPSVQAILMLIIHIYWSHITSLW